MERDGGVTHERDSEIQRREGRERKRDTATATERETGKPLGKRSLTSMSK